MLRKVNKHSFDVRQFQMAIKMSTTIKSRPVERFLCVCYENNTCNVLSLGTNVRISSAAIFAFSKLIHNCLVHAEKHSLMVDLSAHIEQGGTKVLPAVEILAINHVPDFCWQA